MSAVTKRKHVFKKMLEDYSMPEPHQTIVQILRNCGSNLHEVLSPVGERFLASLPVQFRKNIWIKRGDFVVVEPIVEGDKVKAEIVRVLYRQHIKAIKQSNLWPDYFDSLLKQEDKTFPDSVEIKTAKSNDFVPSIESPFNESDFESEDNFSDIEPNTNRPVEIELTSEEDSSDDE